VLVVGVMWYRVAADVVLVIHLLFIAFVVLVAATGYAGYLRRRFSS
jgi:hypothetical protein